METDVGYSDAVEDLLCDGWEDRLHDLLLRAECALRTTSTLLRRRGQPTQAHQSHHFAERVKLQREQPTSALKLRSVVKGLASAPLERPFFPGVLDDALSLTGAERGNVQLVDPKTGALRIVAQREFDREFLEYFAVVEGDGAVCGRAAMARSQMFVGDVMKDIAFAPHREIASASGFRAVTSTPVCTPSGCLIGILSTHYEEPQGPKPEELRLLRLYTERVGEIAARRAMSRAVGSSSSPNE